MSGRRAMRRARRSGLVPKAPDLPRVLARWQRAAVDPIIELYVALRDGAAMAWAMEHAPEGDVDGAVRRVWTTSRNGYVMEAMVRPAIGENVWRDLVARLRIAPTGRDSADGFRAVMPAPPTFAQLLAAWRR